MHIQSLFKKGSNRHCLRESRLCHYQKPGSTDPDPANDLEKNLQRAEKGDFNRDGDPMMKMESHTVELQKRLNALPQTWWDSLAARWSKKALSVLFSPVTYPAGITAELVMKTPVIGGILYKLGLDAEVLNPKTYEAKFDAEVTREARKLLESGGQKLDEARRIIRWRKERAENKLLLLRAKKIVLQDMQALRGAEAKAMAERQNRSKELASFFGKSKDAISVEDVNSKDFFSKTFVNLQKQVNAELKQLEPEGKELELVQKAHILLADELREAGASPEEIEEAIAAMEGPSLDTYFMPAIWQMEELIRRKVPADKQASLIRAANKIAKTPGFRLTLGLESRADDLAKPLDRARQLFTKPPVKPVLFQVGGERFVASPKSRQGNSLLFKKMNQDGKNAYVVVGANGDVAFRTTSGQLVTETFGENKNTLLRNYTTSQIIRS